MHKQQLTIALVGNPNCGKTTLFNAFTGARQSVGNWPGVTVERKSGHYHQGELEVEVVDLPGCYSLDSIAGATSLDEQVAHDYVLSHEADLIVNIVDAANLERNLYLTTQLIEMHVPMVVALNMIDAAEEKGMKIDSEALAERLGCPVLPLVASRGSGVKQLKDLVESAAGAGVPPSGRVRYPESVERAVDELERLVAPQLEEGIEPRWVGLNLLEEDQLAKRLAGPEAVEIAADWRSRIEVELGEELDIIAADARYSYIDKISADVLQRRDRLSRSLSERIDQVVLNRVLGIPLFLGVMYLMFLFTISLGGAFIDFFDGLAGTLLVDGVAELLGGMHAPQWLIVLLADGVGGGIQTVATFIPIIGFLFLFLSFLEDSGYMARAAFIMDRFMRAIGLPGKSFVPLIVGFGCNVPAVMATRTLENPRDRLMTMAMTPFMSCGARLPVYALFAAAFFPVGGQNMVFLLYLVGIAVAIFTGLALKRTLLPSDGGSFVMELPAYHIPTLRGMLTHTWGRLKGFIAKAGKIIVPMVLILNVLNSTGTDGSFGNQDSGDSLLSAVGRGIAPAFAPIGLEEDNWPAAVGVFTGVLAKEAVVGTLDALYTQIAERDAEFTPEENAPFDLWGGIGDAFATIPANLALLADAAVDPLGLDIGDVANAETAAAEQGVTVGTFGAMQHLFGSTAAAFAYLLLILLYFPCVAVLGAVYRETNGRWAAFIALWSSGIGYGAATLFYQLATFAEHPLQSLLWSALVVGLFGVGLFAMGRHSGRLQRAPEPVAQNV